jgi:NAD(P)-dependent dehydrogenase (short-subunit alcohol dehydrogenase family)
VSLDYGIWVAKVVIAARDEGNFKKACSMLDEIASCERFFYRLNIGSYPEVKAFASWCGDKFGSIYGLVNCAGIYGPIGKTYTIDIEKFAETIQINFMGVVNMCHAFIPIMKADAIPVVQSESVPRAKADARRKIISFAGGGAASPFPNYSAYATSKIATVRFTENLSIELADESFDVNCIAPGFVITRLHKDTLAAGPDGATKAFYENTKK